MLQKAVPHSFARKKESKGACDTVVKCLGPFNLTVVILGCSPFSNDFCSADSRAVGQGVIQPYQVQGTSVHTQKSTMYKSGELQHLDTSRFKNTDFNSGT